MQAKRSVKFHDIRERAKRPQVAVVATRNLTGELQFSRPYPSDLSKYVPFALDAQAERLMCVETSDLRKVFQAPFLYHATFAHAVSYCTIPLERLNEITPRPDLEPVFVFSI